MSTEAIPIFLLLLARVIRRGRWQHGLLAGLGLALVGYTRWQLLIPAVIVGGIYLIVASPGRLGRRHIPALVLAAAVTGLALTPPALLLAHEWRTNPADLIIESEETSMQTDVLAYLTPASKHPLLGKFTQPAYERYYVDRGSRSEFSPYLGVTALLLTLLGIWVAPRRDSLPWIAMGLSLVLLALGPVLRVNGRAYPAVPMPYSLVARLFVLRLLRAPERFNMSLAIPVAMLSAYGVVRLLSLVRRYKTWGVVALLGLLGGAVFFEYLVIPLPLQSARVSEFYTQLASEAGDFAVLNVPVDPYGSKPHMYAQTVHHRPILQGRTSRYPKGTFRYLESQAWIRAMRRYSEVPPKHTDISRQLAALASDNIRYVIVHKGLVGADRWVNWERYLAVVPRFQDESIAVYATTVLAGQDFALAHEVVPGLGAIHAITSADCVHAGHVLELDVAWGTTAPPGKDWNVQLALVSRDGVVRQASVFPITRDWPSHEWPANAVAWGYYTLNLPPDLPTGASDVTLALVDPDTGKQRQPVVVEEVYVSPSPCTFATPPGAVGVNALFADAMRLLGYGLEQGEGRLTLVLYWRSDRRMSTDYKVFVHVFDPAAGIPAAQNDAMPLNWTYPTTLWDPGEVVTDVIEISLEEVPSGVYGVAVGVYNPASAERLLVVDGAGQPHPDGRLVLHGETVKVEGYLP